MTKNKALLGDSPDYHLFTCLFIFPSIKARPCSRMYFFFGYFWLLTFPGEDQEEWWTDNTYEHESYTDYNTSICLDAEQLQKETWTPFTWSFVNSKCGGGMWVPRSKFFLNPYLVVKLVLVPASCSIYKKNKKRRVVAMVIILSSHQQNTMVSTLNVLLLTLNKALPGGRPRIARVSLMVRLIFSLNKF